MEQANVVVANPDQVANANGAVENPPVVNPDGTPIEKTPEQIATEAETAKQTKLDEEAKKETHDVRRMKKWINRAIVAETERDALRSQINVNQQPAQPSQEPKRDQFTSDLEYLDARQKFYVEQSVAKLQPQAQQQQVQYVDAAKTYDDYEEVMDEGSSTVMIPKNRDLEDAITSSPNRDAILYHLTKEPAQARAMFAMSPAAAIRVIGKIEAKVEADIEAKKKPAVKPVSQAKPPIEPPVGTDGATVIDEDKLSNRDWWKREQAAKLHKKK